MAIQTGTTAIFRNGESVIVKQVLVNTKEYKTCDARMNTITVPSGYTRYIVEFDDGDTTIAVASELQFT